MTIKLKDIKNADKSLQKLLSTELPIEVSYRLSKFAKKLQIDLDLLEEKRIALIKRYGALDGGTYQVTENKLEEFNIEYQKLLNVDITLDETPIALNDIKPYIKLSAVDLINLEFILLMENT